MTNPSSLPTKQPPRFAELPLSEEVQAGLRALGYERATPVQASAFEPAMQGLDLVVQSKTGTGKTTAFGLPLIERIRKGDDLLDPQALVLCPTRELAIQVCEELAELGDPKGVRVLAIYGGTPMQPQLAALKAGVDVVVGTPGRVLDHIRRRTLRPVHVHVAVLDEADEMLSMGFWDEVTAILDQLPKERQTFLFSATLPDQIRRAAARYLRDPKLIDISRDELTVEGIKNVYYERDDSLPKPRNLLYVLEVERPENAIIFCNTRDDAATVAAALRRQGLNALALSGDFSQKERERIMGRMKRGELRYLVATDIAARGIDISDLSHVINYSLPEFTEVYLHRVGRTGRIGKSGTAISLVSGRDEATFTALGRQFHIAFEKRSLPSRDEIENLWATRVASELLEQARDTEITAYLVLAGRLRAVAGGTEVIAFLLKRYFSELEEARERAARHEEQERQSAARTTFTERTRASEAPAASGEEAGAQSPNAAPEKRSRRRKKGPRDARGDGPMAERPARRGRGRGQGSEHSTSVDEDSIRLFVSLGADHGLDASGVAAVVARASGIDATNAIKNVELRRTHAFLIADTKLAEHAIRASESGLLENGLPVTIERARTR